MAGSAKRPVVLTTTGQRQLLQAGDFIPVSSGGTGAVDAAGAKANLALDQVENKSSATIRGELTSANVVSALGYTPAAQGSGGGGGSTKGTVNVDFGSTYTDYAEVTVTGQATIAATSFVEAKISNVANADFTAEELNSLAMDAKVVCDTPDAVAHSFVIRILLTSGYASGLVPVVWSWS